MHFSHNLVGDGGYLGMELEYLIRSGYSFDPRSNTAYPPID